MRSISIFQIGVVSCLSALIIAVSYLWIERPRIAYVRSSDLIEKYQGTIEARTDFERKKNAMVANVDSMKLDFERAKNQYLSNASRMTATQQQEQEKILTQQQGQLVRYSEAIDQKVDEEDAKMMQEVLNQVNSFVESYAIRNKYSIIFGTTLSGNLLYGEKPMDITDQLIVELNRNYKGK